MPPLHTDQVRHPGAPLETGGFDGSRLNCLNTIAFWGNAAENHRGRGEEQDRTEDASSPDAGAAAFPLAVPSDARKACFSCGRIVRGLGGGSASLRTNFSWPSFPAASITQRVDQLRQLP